MPSVLDGVRVLDLSWGVAGPVAGMLLADHGADVVKIEPPGGDPFRGMPGYDCWLRGRRSAVLDLRDAVDAAAFDALARDADVVLSSFGPGVDVRLGVDAATLLARHPHLVVCSISAYGRHAGLADRPGYDALVAARLGLLHEQRGHLGGPIPSMAGEPPFLEDLEIPERMPPGSPRSGPIFTHTPWPSMSTAFQAVLGISAALYARERTGRGQHVETSLLQAAMSLTASKWIRAEHDDVKGFRTWTYDSRATKGMFRCADGRWIQQWVPNPRFALSSAEGDELALRGVNTPTADPERITTEPENIVVLAHYHPLMEEAFAKFPSGDWVRVATQANVPLQPVRTPEEALADEALLGEGAVVDVPHPVHGTLRQAGILYTLSETPGRVRGPVPLVGAHDEEVRAEAAAFAPRTPSTDVAAASAALPLGPLSGVVVLDLGFAVAGPFGTQLLADLGATVIKVNARRDPFWHATHIAYGANRGKRSVGIDLKHPDGLATLHRLIARADVVHSNMRRGALRRLGVDEDSVRAVNPDVIYCHTRGFDKGPRSDSPGNDQTGCSLAGVTFEDGGCHDGGKPFWSLTSLGDTGNGYFSAIGVVQALLHRRRTGVAQSVDTSILNAGLLVASTASVTADGTALARPHLDAMQLGLHAGYRLYPTADDAWVCVAAVTEAQWATFATTVGRHGASRDTTSLHAFDDWFAARTAAQAWAELDAAGVPCEIASEEFGYGHGGHGGVHDDPEMIRNEYVVKQQHPKVGRFEHFGKTIHFSDTPVTIQGPPPVCGQHTREILAEHGFGTAEIDALLASGAIFEDLWVD